MRAVVCGWCIVFCLELLVWAPTLDAQVQLVLNPANPPLRFSQQCNYPTANPPCNSFSKPSDPVDPSTPVPIIVSAAGSVGAGIAVSTAPADDWLRYHIVSPSSSSSSCDSLKDNQYVAGGRLTGTTPLVLCIKATRPSRPHAQGKYQQFIVIAGTGVVTGVVTTFVPATLQVTPGEYIQLTPDIAGKTLSFDGTVGPLARRQIDLKVVKDPNVTPAVSVDAVEFTVDVDPVSPPGAGASWLRVSPDSLKTSAPAGTSNFKSTITLAIDTNLAPAGDSAAVVHFKTTGAYASSVDVGVTLKMPQSSPGPVDATAVNLAFPAGPLSAQRDLAGTGSFSTQAATADGTGWLNVDPTSGNLPATVRISASVDGTRPAGSYQGTVTITPRGGAPTAIPVTLTVVSLKATPPSLELNCPAGGRSDNQTVRVEASDGSAVGINLGVTAPWLRGLPGRATTPATLTFWADCSQLSAGDAAGAINITPDGVRADSNSGPRVDVKAHVGAVQPVNPQSLSFRYDASLVPDPDLKKTLRIEGGFSITGKPDWLALSAASGTTATSLTLTADPTSLSPRSTPYQATLNVSYTVNGTRGSQDVTLAFLVTGRPVVVPLFLDGNSFQTTLQLVNPDSAATGYSARFWQPQGEYPAQTSGNLAWKGVVPGSGASVIQTGGGDPSTLSAGWMEAVAGGSLSGVASIQHWSGGQEAIVPLSGVTQRRFLVPFDNVLGRTLVNLANAGPKDSGDVGMLVRTAQASGSEAPAKLPARGFTTVDLSQLASAAGQRGVVEFSSPVDLYAVPMRTFWNGSIATFDPVAYAAKPDNTARVQPIPLLLDSPAVQTSLILVNNSDDPQPYALQFFRGTGSYAPPLLSQQALAGTIPVRSSLLLQTNGTSDAGVQNPAWGELKAPRSVTGLAVYQQGTDGRLFNGLQAEATASFELQAGRRFLVPFDHTRSFANKLIVVNSAGTGTVKVTIGVRGSDGAALGQESPAPVGARTTALIDLTQLPSLANAQGVAEITADSDVTILVQRYGPLGVFALFPPLPR